MVGTAAGVRSNAVGADGVRMADWRGCREAPYLFARCLCSQRVKSDGSRRCWQPERRATSSSCPSGETTRWHGDTLDEATNSPMLRTNALSHLEPGQVLYFGDFGELQVERVDGQESQRVDKVEDEPRNEGDYVVREDDVVHDGAVHPRDPAPDREEAEGPQPA